MSDSLNGDAAVSYALSNLGLTFAVAFLVLFMKRSVAEKGAHMAQSE